MKRTFQIILLSFLLCGLALVLPGCRTQKGFNRIADNNKDWLAEKCSEEFPIDTSINTNTVYIKADNPDLTKEYEALKKQADSLRNSVKTDTIYSEKECNELLQSQRNRIDKLNKAISDFNYKKCLPDTVKITIKYTVKDNRELFLVQKKNEEQASVIKTQKVWLRILGGIVFLVISFIGVKVFLRV